MSVNETRVNLYLTLTERFNDGEIRTLCFALGVDYDSLLGQAKTDKARELVAYLERRHSIPHLIMVGKQLRPDIDWPNTFKDEQTPFNASPELKRPLNIMVSGGREVSQEVKTLAFWIGQHVILRDHILLSNGSIGVDKISSEGAFSACQTKDLNPNIKIQVFRPRNAPEPHFDFGNLQVVGTNYDERRNFVVQRSNAIIVLGGGSGTAKLARQARIAEKPVIPIGIGKSSDTAVNLWNQMKNGFVDDLPLEPIRGEDLQSIGPGQEGLNMVALSAVKIAEGLIYGT